MPAPDAASRQDGLYAEAAATYGAALERLARAYERDADRRLDLLQEVHVALWRSFASFDGRCSLGKNTISLEEIRGKAQRLERIVARRNLREYAAAAVVVPSFGWIMWVGPSGIIRIGAGMVILGTLFIVYHLRLRGSASALPADMGLKSALEFHRLELVRQRDLLRSVWWWYVLPMLPGMLVMQIGLALVHPERLTRIVLYCVVVVGVAAGIHWLNRRGAARIQERIDRLTADS